MINLTESEKLIFNKTKSIKTIVSWRNFLSNENCSILIKSLYDKGAYNDLKTKEFLDRIYLSKSENKIEIKNSKSNTYHEFSITAFKAALSHSHARFLIKVDSARMSTEKIGEQALLEILQYFKEDIPFILKLQCAMKCPLIAKKLNLKKEIEDKDIKKDFKKILLKEILSLYPKEEVFLTYLKKETFEAIKSLTENEIKEMLSSEKIISRSAIYRTKFETFFFNSSILNIEEIKELLCFYLPIKQKYNTGYCIITKKEYEALELIKQTNIIDKKLLITTMFKNLNYSEIKNLLDSNIVYYPLSSNSINLQGREKYLLSFFDSLRNLYIDNSKTISYTRDSLSDYLLEILTPEDFIYCMDNNVREYQLLKDLILNKEIINFQDGNIKFKDFFEILSLNNDY